MKVTVRTELPSTDMGRDTGGTEGAHEEFWMYLV